MNEYLEFAAKAKFGDFSCGEASWTARAEGRARFAWAIPNNEALDALLALGPIIEIGAGCGYWAHLLRALGGDVVAYDLAPPVNERHENGYCRYGEVVGVTWTLVLRGGPSVLTKRKYRDRALFLCWPPYGGWLGKKALQNYRGKTLAYIGEDRGGCCATDSFFDILERDWAHQRRIRIPQWDGLHDSLNIWVRA